MKIGYLDCLDNRGDFSNMRQMTPETLLQKFSEHGWRQTLAVRKTADLLLDTKVFLSAYEIEERLEKAFDVTTIYRVLEKFQAVKLVHELNGKWKWCTDPHNHEEQHHFLICGHCAEAEEIFLDYEAAIREQLSQEKKFRLKQVQLAFLGTCHACQLRGRD